MRVHWTNNSIGHLLGIYEYIARNSPVYAKRIVDRITRRSEQIADFPMSGRKVPEYEAEDIREVKGEAVVFYRKPFTTKELRRHRLSHWVNNMAVFTIFHDVTWGQFHQSTEKVWKR